MSFVINDHISEPIPSEDSEFLTFICSYGPEQVICMSMAAVTNIESHQFILLSNSIQIVFKADGKTLE